VIVRVEPQERGSKPKSLRMDRAGNGLQIIAGGENSSGADESGDLKYERVEGGEIDQAEGAEENPARPEVAGAAFGCGLGSDEPVDNRGQQRAHTAAIIPMKRKGCRTRGIAGLLSIPVRAKDGSKHGSE